jgi:hypothetical protein
MEQSDFGSLSATLGKSSRLYTCRKWVETAAILLGLIGGGTGLGYYFGIQQGEAVHLAEIDRLRDAYRDNLYTIVQDVKSATTQLDDAANTASVTAQKAAKQSTRGKP